MPLLESLPTDVQTRLLAMPEGQRLFSGNGAGHFIFESDLSSDGRFGAEWLIEAGGSLVVIARNGNMPEIRRETPLADVLDVHAEMQVGNGVIVARTATESIPLVRFTQATNIEANAAARRLDALVKGKDYETPAMVEQDRRCPRCKRPLPEDSDSCLACLNKGAVMLRLFQFLKPYKPQVFGGLGVLIALSLVELAPPYIGGRIVDTLAHPSPSAWSAILSLVGILATTRVAASILQYAQRRLSSFIGARTLMDIRTALFQKFTQLSLGYYDKRSTGSVMSRVTNDADNLWDFLMDGLPWLLTNTLQLTLTSLILFKMNWQLAAWLLTPAPFIWAVTHWLRPIAHRRFSMVWHRISRMNSMLNSALTGMKVIKAFAQESKENNRFEERNRRIFEASFAANAVWAIYFPAIGLAMGAGAIIIWLLGGYYVLHGTMTIGALTAFAGYLMQFYAPFQNFSRALDWSTRSATAAERVFEVLDTEPDIRDSRDSVAMPRIEGAVEFDNVAFTYDKGRRVLEDFCLKVNAGEMIGLVGHSGAGKSTIINLLSRFYDVTEGAIKVDGVDIRKIRAEDYRRQFGIVLQDPYLFPGTIRDNIAYARQEATVEEIMNAAKAANCHDFILKFPDGYDTFVGERGQRLSGGERQRISIARAILHDPRILILDEATASVDTETEKQIQEAIQRLVENRTTFAIAHRLSTLRNADRLVVMKEGRMVEFGSHDELMEQNGVYAELVNIQNEVNRIRAV